MAASMGCTIGVKERNNILFVSPMPIPESAKGAPVIATNEPIKLSVLNKPELIFKQKVTGYVLVDPWTWEKLLEVWNARGR
jgi:hypothetical protein